jgi:hypothetical protein
MSTMYPDEADAAQVSSRQATAAVGREASCCLLELLLPVLMSDSWQCASVCAMQLNSICSNPSSGVLPPPCTVSWQSGNAVVLSTWSHCDHPSVLTDCAGHLQSGGEQAAELLTAGRPGEAVCTVSSISSQGAYKAGNCACKSTGSLQGHANCHLHAYLPVMCSRQWGPDRSLKHKLQAAHS